MRPVLRRWCRRCWRDGLPGVFRGTHGWRWLARLVGLVGFTGDHTVQDAFSPQIAQLRSAPVQRFRPRSVAREAISAKIERGKIEQGLRIVLGGSFFPPVRCQATVRGYAGAFQVGRTEIELGRCVTRLGGSLIPGNGFRQILLHPQPLREQYAQIEGGHLIARIGQRLPGGLSPLVVSRQVGIQTAVEGVVRRIRAQARDLRQHHRYSSDSPTKDPLPLSATRGCHPHQHIATNRNHAPRATRYRAPAVPPPRTPAAPPERR